MTKRSMGNIFLGEQEMPEKTKPQGSLKRVVSPGHHSFYRVKEESIKSEVDSEIKGNKWAGSESLEQYYCSNVCTLKYNSVFLKTNDNFTQLFITWCRYQRKNWDSVCVGLVFCHYFSIYFPVGVLFSLLWLTTYQVKFILLAFPSAPVELH